MNSIKGLDLPSTLPNGVNLKILIVKTSWNTELINALVEGAVSSLQSCQVTDIDIVTVPGSFELPLGVSIGLEKKKYDAAIAIGVLIKGSTMHFEVGFYLDDHG
jgi:6,7-dimethyl-8-ribityllumazine synthase